jgi:hypothetical protein
MWRHNSRRRLSKFGQHLGTSREIEVWKVELRTKNLKNCWHVEVSILSKRVTIRMPLLYSHEIFFSVPFFPHFPSLTPHSPLSALSPVTTCHHRRKGWWMRVRLVLMSVLALSQCDRSTDQIHKWFAVAERKSECLDTRTLPEKMQTDIHWHIRSHTLTPSHHLLLFTPGARS